MRIGELADATPARRDRYVDFLRASAIVTVVIGHWLAVTVTFGDGRLGGEHLLAVLPWTHWLTWLFQVMGIFFLVGGYANAASWDSARRRGDGYPDWLGSRADRLLRPTTLFVVIGVVTAAAARLAGTTAACVGIFRLTVGGFRGAGPAGVPLAGLITYFAGLLAFWAARCVGAPRPDAAGAGGDGEGAGRHG